MSGRRIAGLFAAAALLLFALPATGHEAPRKHHHTKSGRVVWTGAKPATPEAKPAAASEKSKDEEQPAKKADEPNAR